MTVAFTFTVASSHEIEIEWYHDDVLVEDGTFSGVTVSGAATNTLTITNPTVEWDGQYYAIVRDLTANCEVQTNPVDVETPGLCHLAITAEPEGETLTEGDTLELSVAYAGQTGSVTIQWYLDGSPLTNGPSGGSTISGVTSATLTITNMEAALAGNYTVALVDDGIANCSVESNAAVVVVQQACDFIIDPQPRGTGYEEDDEIVLTVGTSGGIGPFTYQWYHNGVALVDGPSGDYFISGATTATLIISSAEPENAGSYTVEVTDTGAPGECTLLGNAVNVYYLFLIENFEGANGPAPNCYDLLGWYPETTTGGSVIANTTTPICDTCSLRLIGGVIGQETDCKHSVPYPQSEAWVHVRVRVNSTPLNDSPIIRIGASGNTTPASGELRVVMRSAANGRTIQITSGAASAETVALYSAGVDYHFWVYYNATLGTGWVKFGTASSEPSPGDYMASYTGGSNATVDYIFLQALDDRTYDFDTVRWANFPIGDIDC